MIDKKCWCGGRVGFRQPSDAGGQGCLDSVYHDWSSNGDPKVVSRLYVAGPMTGFPGNNYPLFNSVANSLRQAGFEVVNPAEFGSEGGSYVDLLRQDLRVMLDCHGIAVLEGWWRSKGACNEVNVGGLLRMPVRTWEEWISRAPHELRDTQPQQVLFQL